VTAPTIESAVDALGSDALHEAALVRHIHPLFSRVLARREIYLANHSLGRPLDQTADDVREALDAWYTDMDDAWMAWMAEIDAFRARTSRLIGCARADAVVMKTAAGQGLRAVLNALPAQTPRIVATRGEFDSLDFILKVYRERTRAEVRLVDPDDRGVFHVEHLCREVERGADLVIVSHIVFATGQIMTGLEQLVACAHRAGALVLLDTYHSAGVIPVEFDALGVDFAIGGSYKYLRGGPGACWLAIAPHVLESHPALRTLDTGWFAKRDTFSYRRTERPEWKDGGDAWLESTPPFLTAYQARAGQQLTLGIGVERLRAYSLRQQAELAGVLASLGVPVRELPNRGAFLLVPTEDAAAACDRLKHAGVNADARNGCVRLCPDILNTQDELDRAAAIIARVIKA
jgi:kynureninase